MAKAKSIGWAIYVAGFVIWLFGYLSTGAHVREHDPDLLARGTEATVMRDTLQEAA